MKLESLKSSKLEAFKEFKIDNLHQVLGGYQESHRTHWDGSVESNDDVKLSYDSDWADPNRYTGRDYFHCDGDPKIGLHPFTCTWEEMNAADFGQYFTMD